MWIFEEPISTKEDAFNIRNMFYFTLCVSERVHIRGGIVWRMYTCVYVSFFKYNICRHIFGMHWVHSQWQCSCQTCVCSSSTLAFPISSLMSFSNVSTAPNVPLKFMAFKTWYACIHIHTCTCVHLLHLCDSLCDFITHKCGGAESALCGPHNAQTFFQFAGQVGLSGA